MTKRAVDALAPGDKPYFVYDAKLPGFGVRVMPAGAKTFILEYRPGAGGRSVTKRRAAAPGVQDLEGHAAGLQPIACRPGG